jgi:putative transposase
LAHHVILRGNNRQSIFVDRADRELLLALLAEHAGREQVQVHAYVLMEDHLHLLVTPAAEGALSRLMQAVGRSYVRRFNLRHGRSGTLWEGRYRATVLEAERYLLPCMVYFDLSPVSAGLVAAPQAYPWSSHAHYVGLRAERWLTPPHQVWALGNTPFAREAAYGQLVVQGVAEEDVRALSESALKGWALGSDAFMAEVAERTQRRVQKRKPGRPPHTT